MDIDGLYTIAKYNLSAAWDRVHLAQDRCAEINGYRKHVEPTAVPEVARVYIDTMALELLTDLSAAAARLGQASRYLATLSQQLQNREAPVTPRSPMFMLCRTAREDLDRATQEYNAVNHFLNDLRREAQ